MRTFDLYKHNFIYSLEYQGVLICSRRFNTENEAILWFKNFITSFPASHLKVNFEV